MRLHAIVIGLTLVLGACGQPEAPPPAPPIASGIEAEGSALTETLTPVVSGEIGTPVSLQIRHVAIMNEWAWLIAAPRQPDGAPLDWSTTNFAGAQEHGVLGEDGAVYALLKREDGGWRVVDHVVGPTDVAWESWPQQYGAPAALFETR